jgi:hypothetical protein
LENRERGIYLMTLLINSMSRLYIYWRNFFKIWQLVHKEVCDLLLSKSNNHII